MKLIDAPVGLFKYGSTLALKTEYSTEVNGIGTPDCYIVDSGEFFWGGTSFADERNNLDVDPVKAARLMGYEVVEEDNSAHTITTGYKNCPQCGKNEGMIQNTVTGAIGCMECGWTNKEEVNMEKPRIAQVLGVEVGERFTLETIGGEYWIDKTGHIKYEIAPLSTTEVCELINGDIKIVRFTEQEREDAKALKRIFGKDIAVSRSARGELTANHVYIDRSLFPSIRCDERVLLHEIIGGEA